MRYLIATTCFAILIVLAACTGKKKTAASVTSTPDLSGTWELREAQNGMMPNQPYSPGNGNQLRFTATMFEEYREGQPTRSDSYTLVPDSTVSESVGLELPKEEFAHRLIFSKDTTEKTFVAVSGDTLTVVSGFFPVDAGSHRVYVKTKNNR